ncbi:hypothetical protein [Oceanobacter mangrovi]|uniref:hypothetical protein n=1 Tax=Oceanobacter mangrovi TaxID=2862510 RepID=UPI001C8EB6F5|nr:hypothetical protein [Oceanobacter mangrovi]
MLTGKNNPYFLRHQGLRLVAGYSLVMALSLGLLALVDWIDSQSGKSLGAAVLALIMGVYGIYLLWRDRPFETRWTERAVVVVLISWALTDALIPPVSAHAAYWLPFYLVFAFSWQQAARITLIFSVVFAGILLAGDLGLRGQLLVTYLLTAMTALCLGWVNDRGDSYLQEQLGSDPQTGTYTGQQLAIDLAKEIRRTDRQASRLLLAVVVIPQRWQQLRRDQYLARLENLAIILKASILPFHTIYKLDSNDFLVMMPHGKGADMLALEQRLHQQLEKDEEIPIVALHYQADDDLESLMDRIEGALHDFRS